MIDISYISELNLREADRLEVTILVDNYTDMLLTESTGLYRRPQIPFPQILLAEHGFSCLINQFAEEMPEQLLLNIVGTTYVFGTNI